MRLRACVCVLRACVFCVCVCVCVCVHLQMCKHACESVYIQYICALVLSVSLSLSLTHTHTSSTHTHTHTHTHCSDHLPLHSTLAVSSPFIPLSQLSLQRLTYSHTSPQILTHTSLSLCLS